MAIYTKKGDKGKTSLFSGKRVSKSDVRVETYGQIDELNSLLGVVKTHIPKKYNLEMREISETVDDIQHALFYIASYLADLPDVIEDIDLDKKTSQIEHKIDAMTQKMEPLNNFIIPGGGQTASYLQLARSVSRRVERQLVRLNQKESVDGRVVKYLNRLSDLLFTMARYANHIEKIDDPIWER